MESALNPSCRALTDECNWVNDMARVFTSLHVVDNNDERSIGGGGILRQPCAPPFDDGSGAPPASCSAVSTSNESVPRRHQLRISAVYPQPSTDHLTVEVQAESSSVLTVRVHDVLGREVYLAQVRAEAVGVTQVVMDTELWGGGHYVLSVEDGVGAGVRRVVVMR